MNVNGRIEYKVKKFIEASKLEEFLNTHVNDGWSIRNLDFTGAGNNIYWGVILVRENNE
jgi:hypothetical protein